tara:strand:+ start:15979 stop:16314 length:336 start_codon:yes stop_codon:yes gene_type:complete
MSHQDWNNITFNTVSNNIKKEEQKKAYSNKPTNSEMFKLEQSKNLGQLISQSRLKKELNQKDLANKLGISVQTLNRWESNKETLTNAQISLIDKALGVKLPRNKKVKREDI